MARVMTTITRVAAMMDGSVGIAPNALARTVGAGSAIQGGIYRTAELNSMFLNITGHVWR